MLCLNTYISTLSHHFTAFQLIILLQERDEENSLYSFLGRIRLNIALDALKTVRCVSRSADRHRLTHALLHDVVFGHHRRSIVAKKLNAPVIQTYTAPLDDTVLTILLIK